MTRCDELAALDAKLAERTNGIARQVDSETTVCALGLRFQHLHSGAFSMQS